MGQKYTEEYKADVLKLTDEIGVSAAFQRLGISTKTVYNWRRAVRLARGEMRGVEPCETPEPVVARLGLVLEQKDSNSSTVDEGQKKDIQFVRSGSNSPKPFDFLKKTLNQMPLLVQMPIYRPGLGNIFLRRNDITGPTL